MRIWKYMLFLCVLVLSTGAYAQLSTLRPLSMTRLSEPNNGSKNSAHIEIEFSAPLTGAKVVRDSENSTPDAAYPASPTRLHAKGLAIDGAGIYAQKVTVVHPDFTPCVIDFESLGFSGNIKPGGHYLIQVEVPDLPLIEANRAFSNLDFATAAAKYQEYLASGDGKDASLANQRIAVMKELDTPVRYIEANASKTDKATRFRCMKAAESIYNKTHSSKAYGMYNDIRTALYGRTAGDVVMDEGVTELRIDTAYLKAGDNRPMSDNKLPHVDGAPFYSWIDVKVDLNDVVFTGGNQFLDAERVDGVYRLYVPKGREAAEEIVMRQPDCASLSLALKDFGIDKINPASVYVIEIPAPSAAIIEADRAFGNLDFTTAQMLYSDILNDADGYDDLTVSTAASRLEAVIPLVDNDVQSRWNTLKKDISLKNGPLDRDQLSKKCMKLSALASELDRLNVPGMATHARTYSDLAKEYRTSVFLTLNARQLNSHGEVMLDADGNPGIYSSKNIVLVFDKIGDLKNVEVPMEATSNGVFKKYLPPVVSEWLNRNPGRTLKVTPKQYVRHGGNMKLDRIGKDFELGLVDSDRTLSMTVFLQSK